MRLLTANFGWKLLSLLLAVVIWVAVAGESELESVVSVPVQFKDGPQNLAISSEIVSTVKLELKGVSGRLRSFSSAPSPVVLDFSRVRAPGERTFTVSEQNLRLPRGVELIASVPGQLSFIFERKLTRAVPVRLRFSGATDRHPPPLHSRIDPAQMEITGPESRVNSVGYVVTDPIDLTRHHLGDSVFTSPYCPEPMVRFFKPRPIHVILSN